jgi:predicted phosphoadenosine phosphosulfate sulfurtransferase
MMFDRFDDVVVLLSGGKDGHVVAEIAYAEAVRRGRPLRVAFYDQELIAASTVNVVSDFMRRPDVVPMWYQIEAKHRYAPSLLQDTFVSWEPGKTWVRDKDVLAFRSRSEVPDGFPFERVTGGGVWTSSAWVLFLQWLARVMGPEACLLHGIRASDTNTRLFMVTRKTKDFPGIRWSHSFGSASSPIIYPLYDWSDEDIWSFMSLENVAYNTFYDCQYRLGVPLKDLCADYLIASNAFPSLAMLRHFEPDTYERIVERTGGVARIAAMYADSKAMFSKRKEPKPSANQKPARITSILDLM